VLSAPEICPQKTQNRRQKVAADTNRIVTPKIVPKHVPENDRDPGSAVRTRNLPQKTQIRHQKVAADSNRVVGAKNRPETCPGQ